MLSSSSLVNCRFCKPSYIACSMINAQYLTIFRQSLLNSQREKTHNWKAMGERCTYTKEIKLLQGRERVTCLSAKYDFCGLRTIEKLFI